MEANTKFLIFDTETTGLFGDTLNPETPDYYPQIIQISWVFFGLGEQNIQIKSFYINPSKRINSGASAVYGLKKDFLKLHGTDPLQVFHEFLFDAQKADILIAHNIKFDFPILESELFRLDFGRPLKNKRLWCTMLAGKEYWGSKKYPKLIELAEFCNDIGHCINIPNKSKLHDATVDVDLTLECFIFLLRDNSHLFKDIKIRYKRTLKPKTIEVNIDLNVDKKEKRESTKLPTIECNTYNSTSSDQTYQTNNTSKNQEEIIRKYKKSGNKNQETPDGCAIIIALIIISTIFFFIISL